MNHFMMLDYPIISENKITHFIYYPNLVKSENKSTVQDVIVKEISKIYSACVGYM